MESQYGLLLNQDAKLHRKWFEEMTSLLGIKVKYFPPVMDYTLQGEMWPLKYEEPEEVGVIFEEHIDQKTAKKLGWNAELVDKIAMIHMPYDLKGIDSEFRHLLKYNPERCIEKKIEILEEIGSYEEALMACDELINMIPSEENFLKKMELLRKLGKNEEIDLIYKDMANKGNI